MNELLPRVKEALSKYSVAYEVLECKLDLADTTAFCEHYGYDPNQAANTILVASRNDPVKYAVCVLLATTKLDVNKKVCRLLGVKRASFASGDQTVALTGMMIGGVSVFGIDGLPIYVDEALLNQQEVVMGGGNRSSKILLNPSELEKIPNVQIVEGLAKPKI